MPELTAPIVYKNYEKRIVFGPVLIPDEPDTDEDVVSAEQIEKVAHKFVEDYGNIDLMHSLNNVGRLVESYILPVDIEVSEDNTIPKGSWMMGVRVTDNDSWEAVKSGKLGGFSIMALQKVAVKSAEKNQESKRVTLADLGDDWIVNAVSLVDEPAVPKAKWVAIKSKNKEVNNEVGIEAVKKAISGSLEHRKELVEVELDKQFTGYDRFPIIHSTMQDSVVFRIIDEMEGTRKTYQVGYSLAEDGTVNFTSEPQEVLVQETIVDIENMLGGGFKSQQDEEVEEQPKDGVMARFLKGLGFNKDKDKNEVEEGTKTMEKEQVQELINESMKSLDSKLDEVLKSLDTSSQEVESSEEEQTTEEEEQTEQAGAEKSKPEEDGDGYKEKYEEALEKLESFKSKKVPFSNRLTGQDGAVEKSAQDEVSDQRNAFGYKIK